LYFFTDNIRYKILLPLTIVSIIGGYVLYNYFFDLYSTSQTEALVGKARAVLLSAESARETAAQQTKMGVFRDDIKDLDTLLLTVPIVIAMETASKKADELGFKMKIPKVSPRNPINEPDEYELRVLKLLESKEYEEYWEIDEATNSIRYFRPVELTAECLDCHGDPATSQEIWGNDQGLDISGVKMENWKAGDIHGAFEIIMDLAPMQAEIKEKSMIIAYSAGGLTLFIIVFTFIISYYIANKTKKLQIAAKSIAAGDFNVNIKRGKSDELDDLANSFDDIRSNVSNLLSEIKGLNTAMSDGHLNVRGKATDMSGSYKEILLGLNNTLDSALNPLMKASDYLEKLAAGIMPEPITDNYKGDYNQIKNNLNLCIASIDNLVKDSNKLAKLAISGSLNSRADLHNHKGEYYNILKGVNNTLDAISSFIDVASNLMIADSNGVINYTNKSVVKFLTSEEKNIKKQLPHFSASNLIGQKIDIFHKNPAHQWNLLNRMTDKPYTGIIQVSDSFFKLNVNAINDSEGNRIAFIVEWLNYTSEKRFEQQLTGVIKDMTQGKLSTRMDDKQIDSKDYKEIAQQINVMLDSIVTPLFVAAEYINKISAGNTPELITDEYHGDFNKLKDNLNKLINWMNELVNYVTNIANGDMTANIEKASNEDKIHKWLIMMRDSIKALVDDAGYLAHSGSEGLLNTRADLSKHSGDYRAVIKGINDTLDAVITPINEAINVMQAIADGDLTKNMKGDYKGDTLNFKNSINETISSINKILYQVTITVDEVNEGSRQVASASGSLSQGATEQAASLEEITSSMTEVASQTRTNAENANQASTLTNQAKNAAKDGFDEMLQLNEAMSEIQKSSQNISKIIKVIDEIAFQTNLLALNAAVEAARAGRHGKGFAVVAEEVRNLAARSATAAKETSAMIEGSIKTVTKGGNLAIKTREALENIQNAAIKAADIVGEIAISSDEQAQAISQINIGLTQIDKVTQTNTATAEEAASSSDELSSQARKLNGLISKFQLASSNLDEQIDNYEYGEYNHNRYLSE